MCISSSHQCRQLERKTLTATCRKNCQQGFSPNSRFHCLLLHRNAIEDTELIISKELFQPVMSIQTLMTIFAITTRCVAQHVHHIHHLWVISYHPCWSDGKDIVSTDYCQTIRQLDRILFDQGLKICVTAYFPLIFL